MHGKADIDDILKQRSKILSSAILAIMSVPDIMVFIKNKDLVYLAANEAFLGITRCNSEAELIGLTDREVFAKESIAESYIAEDRKYISAGSPNFYKYTETFPRSDGTFGTCIVREFLLFDTYAEDTELQKVLGELTAQKKATKDLAASPQAPATASLASPQAPRKIIGIMGLVEDVSVESFAQKTSARRESNRTAQAYDANIVREITQHIINTKDIDGMINDVLEILGECFSMSRVYIFEDDDLHEHFSNTYEWCAEGITPQINNLQNIPYTDYGKAYFDLYNKQGIATVDDITTLPSHLRNLMELQDIRSMVHCALYDNDVFTGYIGFDDCNGTRIWTDNVVGTLWMATRLLALVIVKERHKKLTWVSEDYVAIANIFSASYRIDIADRSYTEIRSTEWLRKKLGHHGSTNDFIAVLSEFVSEGYRSDFLTFLKLDDFARRIDGENFISFEFLALDGVWLRTNLIPISTDEQGNPSSIIIGILKIDREKRLELQAQEALRTSLILEEENQVLSMAAIESNDFIAVINITNDMIELRNGSWFSRHVPTPEHLKKLSYSAFISYVSQNYCLSTEDGKVFLRTLAVDSIVSNLSKKDECIIPFSFFDAKNKKIVKRKQFRLTWLDRKAGLILVSGMDITQSFMKDQQLIIDDLIIKKTALDNVDFVAVLEPKSGDIVLRLGNWVTGIPTPEWQKTIPYTELLSMGSTYTSSDSATKRFYEVFSVASVIKRLETEGEITIYFDFQIPADNNLLHKKQLRYIWLDEKKEKILVTRTDITESVKEEQKRNAELKDALEAAQQASQAKSSFFSRMSHDIRTPMNAIIGFSTLLLQNANDPEKVREDAKKVLVSSNHLLGLINDVLDMSKIESGKLQISENKFLLSDVISMTDSIMRPEMEKKHQQFDIYVSDIKHETLISDENRLQQVLINLLSNATKYTDDGGAITLRVKGLPQSSGQVENISFEIGDNGRGMSEAYQKVLFTPFSREEQAGYKDSQGTGLGLAITRNLVDMMGGNISVRSKLGIGSVFTVVLPFGIYDSGKETEFWKNHGLTHMLAVDDETEVLDNIAASMEDTGVRLELAWSGAMAVDMIKKAFKAGDGFDIVLLDWVMPGMDGLECARHIRKEASSDVLIIILTAYDYTAIEDEARKAGVNAFLQKPFFSYSLMRAVQDMGQKDNQTDIIPKKSANNVLAENKIDDILCGLHILAAEDNDLNAELLKEILKHCGSDIIVEPDGKATLERFEAEPPGTFDLILMDIQMPVMNGYESTRAIRALTRSDASTIPIIAMTANAFNEDVQKCLLAGMNAHVAKPLDLDVLRKKVAEFVR